MKYDLVCGSLDQNVDEVIYDSRKARPDSVFVCIQGSTRDSHEFIPDVLRAGCKVLVVEKEVEVPADVTVIRVESGRLALAELSAARFGYPAEKLITIGITGTKGKTTTSYMIKAVLEAAGKKTGLIGTNGAVIGDVKFPTSNTTPESYVVQDYFHKMVEAGCECCVMEVSSQALMLHRVGGIMFDYGLFTNISPDHIGPKEHKSFEEYLFYKSRLLTVCKTGIVNRLTDHYDEVVKDATCRLLTYALNGNADFMGDDIHYASNHDFVGIEFSIHGMLDGRVRVGMPGKFNADNALAALAVCTLALSGGSGVLDAFEQSYDEGADSAAWFDGIKAIASAHGFAADMKAYKADPDAYKGSVADVSMFLRLAVTGKTTSPDLYEVMHILGRERVMQRIAQFRESL